MRENITVISGHYGSGKSEVSINLAVKNKVNMLIDLDIVNPYFRSRETEKTFNSIGIEVISSPLGNLPGSDLPYLSARIYAPFHNKSLKAIYDLGGNDVGAKVFRQFGNFSIDDVDHLFVVNVYREETDTKEKIIKMIKSIESTSGLKVKGLINNTNLLKDTKVEDIYYGQKIINEVAEKLNLDIIYTCIHENIKYNDKKFKGEIVKIKLFLRQDWL